MRRFNTLFIIFTCVLASACAHRSGHRRHLQWAEDNETICTVSDKSEGDEGGIVEAPDGDNGDVSGDKYLSPDEVDALLKCVCDTKHTKLLVRDGYVALYSLDTHCPVYVGWKLTSDRVEGDVKRCKVFFPDEEIAEKDRVTNEDYKGSGWSKGHMCPAADNKDSELRMEQSCILTNICPQDMGLNSGRWNDLENKCRTLARKGYTVYVICGPVFSSRNKRWIGKGVKVAVPDGFFKVILTADRFGRMSMDGYLFPNEDVEAKLPSFSTSVDKIETAVGIDFFSSLDDKVEEELEK